MPGRGNIYDRIPRSAFDANVLMGEQSVMSLGASTRLVRVGSDSIRLTYSYRGMPLHLVTYRGDGSVALHRERVFAMPIIHRWQCVLPHDWTFEQPRRRFGQMMPPRLRYRGQYTMGMESVTRFYPDGAIGYGPEADYRIGMEELDAEVSDRSHIEVPERTVPRRQVWDASQRYVSREQRRRARVPVYDVSESDEPAIAVEWHVQPTEEEYDAWYTRVSQRIQQQETEVTHP